MGMLLPALLLLSAGNGFSVDMRDDDLLTLPTTSTLLGCECSGTCEALARFNCHSHNVCPVKSENCQKGTANFSKTLGYYDYCNFEANQDYEQLSAQQKHALVMDKLRADTTLGAYPSATGVLTGLLSESVKLSFDTSADVMPEGRRKEIHTTGVVGAIKFSAIGAAAGGASEKYTGLFRGAEYGIARLTSAAMPGEGQATTDGITPGMGFKFFRDGKPSVNAFAMFKLDGQQCSLNNFFANIWSNHVQPEKSFGLTVVARKFFQASFCPQMVGLRDLATYDDQGRPAGAPKFPFRLEFQPLVKAECPCEDYAQCMSNIAKFPVGTALFNVFAESAPGMPAELIGQFVLTSPMKPSKFGDERLFFQHQYMEDDFKVHPEWLAQINKKQDCGFDEVTTVRPPISQGCHSPFVTVKNNTKKSLQISLGLLLVIIGCPVLCVCCLALGCALYWCGALGERGARTLEDEEDEEMDEDDIEKEPE